MASKTVKAYASGFLRFMDRLQGRGDPNSLLDHIRGKLQEDAGGAPYRCPTHLNPYWDEPEPEPEAEPEAAGDPEARGESALDDAGGGSENAAVEGADAKE